MTDPWRYSTVVPPLGRRLPLEPYLAVESYAHYTLGFPMLFALELIARWDPPQRLGGFRESGILGGGGPFLVALTSPNGRTEQLDHYAPGIRQLDPYYHEENTFELEAGESRSMLIDISPGAEGFGPGPGRVVITYDHFVNRREYVESNTVTVPVVFRAQTPDDTRAVAAIRGGDLRPRFWDDAFFRQPVREAGRPFAVGNPVLAYYFFLNDLAHRGTLPVSHWDPQVTTSFAVGLLEPEAAALSLELRVARGDPAAPVVAAKIAARWPGRRAQVEDAVRTRRGVLGELR